MPEGGFAWTRFLGIVTFDIGSNAPLSRKFLTHEVSNPYEFSAMVCGKLSLHSTETVWPEGRCRGGIVTLRTTPESPQLLCERKIRRLTPDVASKSVETDAGGAGNMGSSELISLSWL